jgi:hypothetical protein
MHCPSKECLVISENMGTVWVRHYILCKKKYLIEDLPLKEVVRQYLNIMRVAGFCSTLIRYIGQYLTT